MVESADTGGEQLEVLRHPSYLLSFKKASILDLRSYYTGVNHEDVEFQEGVSDQFMSRRGFAAVYGLLAKGGDVEPSKAAPYFDQLVLANAALCFSDIPNSSEGREINKNCYLNKHPLSIYVAICGSFLSGVMDENENVLEYLKNFYPEEYPAFIRDLTRTFNKLSIKPFERPSFLSQDEISEGYENPFDFPLPILDILTQERDNHRWRDFFPHLKKIISPESKDQLKEDFTKKLIELYKLYPNERASNPCKILDEYANKFREIPAPLLFNVYIALVVACRRLQINKSSLDLHYFKMLSSSDDRGYALFDLNNTVKDTLLHIREVPEEVPDPDYLKYLLRAAATGAAHNAAIALHVLGKLAPDDNKIIYEVVSALVKSPEDLESEKVAARLTVFVQNFSLNFSELLKLLVQAFFMNKVVWETLFQNETPDFFNSQELQVWAEKIYEEIYLFSLFDKDLFIDEVVKFCSPSNKKSKKSINFKRLLGDIQLPDDFDSDEKLAKIRGSKSWAPPEPRLLTNCDILPDNLKFYIQPHPNSTEVDSWRIRVEFIGIIGGGFRKGKALFDFVGGKLVQTNIAKLSSTDLRKFEKLGIYLAELYFVRHEPEIKQRETSAKVEKTQSSVPEAAIVIRDLGSDRSAKPRRKEALNVDIRESHKIALRNRKKKVRQLIIYTHSSLKKLAKGETEGIDLEDVFLFVRHEDTGGEDIYERCPTGKIRKHVEAGTLSESGLFVLDISPHLKATGFCRPHVEMEGVEEKDPTKEWKILGLKNKNSSADAEVAFEFHEISGLPKLSDLAEIDTTMTLWANDPGYSREEYNSSVTYESVTYEGEDENESTDEGENGLADEGEDETEIEPIKIISIRRVTNFGINSKLAFAMHDTEWQKEWFAIQEKVLRDEIDEIEHSGLSSDEKRDEVAAREEKISALHELSKRVLKKSKVIIDEKEGTALVGLPFGWVKSRTTFNKGRFIPISKVLNQGVVDEEEEAA